MQRDGDLAALFTVLLFGVVWPAGCNRYNYGVCSSPYKRTVDDPAALMEALKDDKFSEDECIALCGNSHPYTQPAPPDPTSGTGADPCVHDSTGAETSSSSDTGTGTSTGTSTGPDTSTGPGTSTGPDTSTGPGTSTGMGTSTSTDACMTATSTTSSGDTGYDDVPEGLHTCAPIKGALDSLYCFYIDCAYGRRPAGLRSEGRAIASRALGRLFAEAAHLEAASVPAFERLAVALAHHGAPAPLRERAVAAAADERRHAALMTALAAEFGGTPATPEIDPIAPPTLLELARDNAVQGCVGETWAALIARHQADTAELPQIREAMRGLATDETEHAELAWAIDAWLHTKLSPVECTAIAATRAAACEVLHTRLTAAIDHPAKQVAGIPRRSTALALYEGLRRSLWAPTLT
jgi:hypothetical protein